MPRPGTRDAAIRSIRARQIIDSRGNPTLEVDVSAAGFLGRASVPSGASVGKHEALELRDGDPAAFHGKGVSKALRNVKAVIFPRLRGMDVRDQRKIDSAMVRLDGTPNKGRLGANSALGVSMAAARASALCEGLPLFESLRERTNYTLPVPMMNVVNGGEHAGNDLDVQEFVIEPVGAGSCSEAVRMGSEVYHSLKALLRKKYGEPAINVGDEGGFAPPLRKTREALNAVAAAVKAAGYGEKEVRLGIDAAASTFYRARRGTYAIDGAEVSAARLESFYARLVDEFGLLTIEDPFDEEAYEDFRAITKRLGRRARIIGDDIYVTNAQRIQKGIELRATNAILIKLNQIGTVTETRGAMAEAKRAGWDVVVSHRSGETEDPFIAHLATAEGSSFIKAGAPARGERTAKYNELIRIEEMLGKRARYAGRRLR